MVNGEYVTRFTFNDGGDIGAGVCGIIREGTVTSSLVGEGGGGSLDMSNPRFGIAAPENSVINPADTNGLDITGFRLTGRAKRLVKGGPVANPLTPETPSGNGGAREVKMLRAFGPFGSLEIPWANVLSFSATVRSVVVGKSRGWDAGRRCNSGIDVTDGARDGKVGRAGVNGISFVLNSWGCRTLGSSRIGTDGV